jgi:hypothetical protein
MIGEHYPPSSKLAISDEIVVHIRMDRAALIEARDPKGIFADELAKAKQKLLDAGCRAFGNIETQQTFGAGLHVTVTGYRGYWRPE